MKVTELEATLPPTSMRETHRSESAEQIVLKLIDPGDPVLRVIYHRLLLPFFSANDRDSCEAIYSYLTQNKSRRQRRIRFYVAAAFKNANPIGTTIFGFFGWDDFCLMSGHYTAVLPEERGKHLGTKLDSYRQEIAQITAQRFGYRGLDLSVITVPSSNNASGGAPADFSPAEKIWHHLGYKRLDFPFVQLPLADEKSSSPQTLWIKRDIPPFGERGYLSKEQVKRILEACNYFRQSKGPLEFYSEYRSMLDFLFNTSQIRFCE